MSSGSSLSGCVAGSPGASGESPRPRSARCGGCCSARHDSSASLAPRAATNGRFHPMAGASACAVSTGSPNNVARIRFAIVCRWMVNRPSLLRPRALVREAKEVEGFRSFLRHAPLPIRRRIATEFDQACLPVVQLQPELGETRPEFLQTRLRLVMVSRSRSRNRPRSARRSLLRGSDFRATICIHRSKT